MSDEKFTFFYRKESAFSQWHPANFTVDGVRYNCAEQYMMAAKALLFRDDVALEKILNTDDPATQKFLGRHVCNFDDARWRIEAIPAVYRGNEAKFMQNEALLQQLLATAGTTLVEASPRDKIWGIGLAASDPRALDRGQWRGTNWLGEVLTRLREDLLRRQR